MSDIKNRIDEALKQENITGLDKLNKELLSMGSAEEKEALADAYLSMFGQCQYDYMCGKYNEEAGIWELLDWVEKAKKLYPEMDNYHYCRGHVYDMLSEVNTDKKEKLDLMEQSRTCFRAQLDVTPKDSDLLVHLAESILKQCHFEEKYPASTMNEVQALFVSAIKMERASDDQPTFFGFKGIAISVFLNTCYELLLHRESRLYHSPFLQSFKSILTPYLEGNPIVAYHWVDTLMRIAAWRAERELDPVVFDDDFDVEVWTEINKLLENLKDLTFSDEHFSVFLGHLFNNAAQKNENTEFLDQAIRYYLQAHQINNQSWAYPHYIAKCLKEKAIWLLEKGKRKGAKACFDQGFTLLENAQAHIEDFQLSLTHGDFLYEFAKLFETFSNRETLLQARQHFEKSITLGRQFYTQPYYGLAKTILLLDGTQACLDVLQDCGEIFSNEYHVHDFMGIIGDPDFKDVQNEIPKLIETIKKK
ncbi:hypothetical protein OOZ15_18570 [Galbibacter sp. EGI 63066]|uniref:hypothetical protein n=1 Tax=Galbibacter sp. EGI 63066 TaxID=2993559 RepID=UPI0022488933|nr:hypothetical protein [Galbibacter sp. EGI 63066]MCX2681962.1 hypothetical protein [Galbibacter sp. EGI 63066]